MTDTTLGQRIAERRKLLALSQEAFGEKMGVSRQAISKWEADSATPEIEKLIAMSKLFDVSVDWLLGTEQVEHDLSSQIRIAFQPPKPAPVPTEPLTPPAPEPEEPPTQVFPYWLLMVFAGVTVLSLILSVFSLVKLNNQPQPIISETVVATEDPRIEEMAAQLAALSKQLDEVDRLTIHYYSKTTEISENYTELLELLETGTELPDLSTPLPSYAGLTQWSLTGNVSTDITKVTVTLSATASVDFKDAQLTIQKGDRSIASANCTIAGQVITAELEIPADNGYQYILVLNHLNGISEQITLTGHGLSDLTALALPQLRSTAKKFNFYDNPPVIYQGWFNMHLEVPYLASPDAKYEWSNIRIGYYHNNVHVSDEVLHKHLSELSMNAPSLSFEIPTKSFKMLSVEENHTHDLRLEGTLTIDGVDNDFSFPLICWIVRNGDLVKLST